MRHAHAVRRLGGLLASAFLLVTLVAVGATPASAAAASAGGAASASYADGAAIATTPAGNAVIARAPTQILVQAPAPIDAQASRLAVYNQDHKSMATARPPPGRRQHRRAGRRCGPAAPR